MKSSTTKVVNYPNGEYLLPCASCANRTKHRVLALIKRDGMLDGEAGFWFTHEIVQCQGCDDLSYRRSYADDYDLEEAEDGHGAVPSEHVDVYPPRLAGRTALADTHFMPYEVRQVYLETYRALSMGLPVLAGVGIRALVEAVCKDKNAKTENLKQRINTLVKLSLLTSEGAKLLQRLRFMGNEAAHEAKPHSFEKLELALDVVEHLLSSVYVFPAKAHSLPREEDRE